jgi:hypothetical protein
MLDFENWELFMIKGPLYNFEWLSGVFPLVV